MSVKELELLDEGSWALMIEESNVRALQKYHGSMARLNLDYYLSVGASRYYKGYFGKAGLAQVRKDIVRFLLDEPLYSSCVSGIHRVLERLEDAGTALAGLGRIDRFELYCALLCDYIAYYNSVITDTFYEDVFEIVDAELGDDLAFAAKAIKDSLFATNNNDLLTHRQTVDMLEISERFLAGESVDDAVSSFVERYRSTTISSGSPNGISAAEVTGHLKQQTTASVAAEKAFLDNLHFRYDNAEAWSDRTASVIRLSDTTRRLIRNTCELSYLKIRMRETFQKFKVTTRRLFLNELVAEIGKHEFDYMRIAEIADFIRYGTRVPAAELARRRDLTVFELKDDRIRLLDAVPADVGVPDGRDPNRDALAGDVLIGSGVRTYRVRKVEQHEEGLTSFDEFVATVGAPEDVAVVTNVLRPHLVPKLRKFGALLTQYGGYTSHASVLCRELGINSMISVRSLLDEVKTDDHIEVDFDRGLVRRLADPGVPEPSATEVAIDLHGVGARSSKEVGAKAANLMRISATVRIADGFVVTSRALRSIDDEGVRESVLEKLAALKCDRLVVRSSHESEDGGNGSYAGLFESHVDVDAQDTDRVIELARSVHRSQRTDSIGEYGEAEGDMSVIVQEQVDADVSGVLLTSTTFDGYDYLLIEYVVGDLWHLMQGDVTPLSSYIKKTDIISGSESYSAYPAVAGGPLVEQFRSLARIAVDLERQFARRVQIEWGIKDGAIYVFQVRPY